MTPDQIIAEDATLQKVLIKATEERKESIRHAADHHPAILEALETIATLRNASTAHLALHHQSDNDTALETIADTPATIPNNDDRNPLPQAAVPPLPHPPQSVPTPRSPPNKQPSKKTPQTPPPPPPSPTRPNPKKQKNKNQTTPQQANSPPKQTPSPTPPSSSNTTNHLNHVSRPPHPPGASTSSKVRTSWKHCPYTSARAGCLDGKERWWISRLSIRVVVSSMLFCSFDTRR